MCSPKSLLYHREIYSTVLKNYRDFVETKHRASFELSASIATVHSTLRFMHLFCAFVHMLVVEILTCNKEPGRRFSVFVLCLSYWARHTKMNSVVVFKLTVSSALAWMLYTIGCSYHFANTALVGLDFVIEYPCRLWEY